jgi:hypothetical protein
VPEQSLVRAGTVEGVSIALTLWAYHTYACVQDEDLHVYAVTVTVALLYFLLQVGERAAERAAERVSARGDH